MQHCVGHDRGRSSGTDLKLNLNKSTLHKHGRLFRKGDKAKGIRKQILVLYCLLLPGGENSFKLLEYDRHNMKLLVVEARFLCLCHAKINSLFLYSCLAHKEQTHRDGEDDKQISDQARSSFSLALKGRV